MLGSCTPRVNHSPSSTANRLPAPTSAKTRAVCQKGIANEHLNQSILNHRTVVGSDSFCYNHCNPAHAGCCPSGAERPSLVDANSRLDISCFFKLLLYLGCLETVCNTLGSVSLILRGQTSAPPKPQGEVALISQITGNPVLG